MSERPWTSAAWRAAAVARAQIGARAAGDSEQSAEAPPLQTPESLLGTGWR